MKRNHIITGILLLIISFVGGISLAFAIVENNVVSSASNDGWLSFLGGLFGSIISGLIAIYILYVNRKDSEESARANKENTDRIQKENFELSIQAQNTQIAILNYQVRMTIADDVMTLIAELIKIAEDYYLNVADNTYGYYTDKIHRALEIFRILTMKIHHFDESVDLLQFTKIYCQNFISCKPPYDDDKNTRIKMASDKLQSDTETFCNIILNSEILKTRG